MEVTVTIPFVCAGCKESFHLPDALGGKLIQCPNCDRVQAAGINPEEPMTAAEWLACTDPERMLYNLRWRVSERKLRLFACACCRRVEQLLRDEQLRHAVEVAEARADGSADDDEWDATWQRLMAAGDGWFEDDQNPDDWYVRVRGADEITLAVALTLSESRFFVDGTSGALLAPRDDESVGLARAAAQCLARAAARDHPTALRQELCQQATLIRDIFVAPPYRPMVVTTAVLAWNGGTVPKIAQIIYEERTFERLPILADALLDADCNSEKLLAHCRSAGPHVRGCWAVDAILGKS
jgi:hypothetical protein